LKDDKFKENLIKFFEKAALDEIDRKVLKATLKPLLRKLRVEVNGNGRNKSVSKADIIIKFD